MYRSYYRLSDKPFQISPDPKFLWLGAKQKEALTVLKHGVLNTQGFLLLTGDIGTGKTTLVNALMNGLEDNVIVSNVTNPNLDKIEFLNLVANSFNIKEYFHHKSDFLIYFEKFLRKKHDNGKKVLLIIDESHKMSLELLEEVRLFSNIEKPESKLINVFLVGQTELKTTLARRDFQALRQRITITYSIEPLTGDETREYVEHRLNVAGSNEELFSKEAFGVIYSFSRGFPRLVNIICDRALLTGYIRNLQKIPKTVIEECAHELSLPGEEARQETYHLPQSEVRQKRITAGRKAFYPILLLVILSGFYYLNPAQYKDDSLRHGHEVARLSQANQIPALVEKREDTSTYYSEQTFIARVPAAEKPLENTSTDSKDASEKGKRGDASTKYPKQDLIAPVAAAKKPLEKPSADSRNTAGTKKESIQASTSFSQNTRKKVSSIKHDKVLVLFGYASAEVPPASYNSLKELAATLLQNRDVGVIVKGYTDTLGKSDYNRKLSQMRANNIKGYLVGRGISAKRIRAVAMGGDNPLKLNQNGKPRKENRRVEIELTPRG